MFKKYVFITVHDDHVTFRGTQAKGKTLTGTDPVISPDTSDAVFERCVATFSNLGYEIETRDERTTPRPKAALDYNEFGVLPFETQDLFKAAAVAAMKVLKPLTDAATPTETRLIEEEISAAITGELFDIRIKKSHAIIASRKKATGQNDCGGLMGHWGTPKLDGVTRKAR